MNETQANRFKLMFRERHLDLGDLVFALMAFVGLAGLIYRLL